MILLRERREAMSLSQKRLAELSGVPQQTISAIESGDRQNPGIETLWLLSRPLGCQVGDLYRPDGGMSDAGR